MVRKFNPDTLYPPMGSYFNAVEVGPGERLVFSAGLVGADGDGGFSADPATQMEQAWTNVAAFLDGNDMTPENLVRLTMYLTTVDHVPISKAARIKVLGEPMRCAVTGLIVGLFDPNLFIEIDVVAAASQ